MENGNNFERNELPYGDESNKPAPIGEGGGLAEFYPESSSSYEKKEEVRYDDIFDEKKPGTLAFSIVSLVTGILCVICCCAVWVSLVLAVVAIVFAVVSRKVLKYFDGMAIAGLILGIFGAVIGVMVIVFAYGPLADVVKDAIEEYENEMGGSSF